MLVQSAADVLARLELKVREMIRLKNREDVETAPLEVTTSSSDVSDEEQFFFTQPDSEDETAKQTLETKEKSWEKAMEWVAHEEPFSMKPNIKEFINIDGNITSYSINGIKANARITSKTRCHSSLEKFQTQSIWQAI